jgi:hypothetical protein
VSTNQSEDPLVDVRTTLAQLRQECTLVIRDLTEAANRLSVRRTALDHQLAVLDAFLAQLRRLDHH